MQNFVVLEPEVAGGLGPYTVMDSSVHPPDVSDLHYEFEGWLGDDLLESFPCFIVTDRCRDALARAGFKGCSFASVTVTRSGRFVELYPGRELPRFHWLKVTGTAGEDDFGIANDHRLVVSERVLRALKSLEIGNCDLEVFGGS